MNNSGGSVRRLLERSQPGSHRAVSAHIRRGEQMAKLIAERFDLAADPKMWKAKHVRWVLECDLTHLSPARQYDYYRTVRAMAAALGKWSDWSAWLNGPWQYPTGERRQRGIGGRPPRLPRTPTAE